MKFFASFTLLLSLFGSVSFGSELTSQVLAEINMARTSPQEYAQLLAQKMPAGDRDVADAVRFLEHARPLTALSASSGLALGAQLHVEEQGPTGKFGHGSNPFGRVSKFGQWVGCVGENISYGKHDARGIVCQLIVDRGVSGKGHRKNIFSTGYGVAGVAFGPHAAYGAMCVIDFAGRFIEHGSSLASL
jgi:hypothetical protein